MWREAIVVVGVLLLFALGAFAQEQRSEVSVRGTGFFTKDTNGLGISQRTTEAGGFLTGYRFQLNRWLAAETNYGFSRDTQLYHLYQEVRSCSPTCTRRRVGSFSICLIP